ncbi:hypothetical protein [Candidatus Vidania fulgoroideorum]
MKTIHSEIKKIILNLIKNKITKINYSFFYKYKLLDLLYFFFFKKKKNKKKIFFTKKIINLNNLITINYNFIILEKEINFIKNINNFYLIILHKKKIKINIKKSNKKKILFFYFLIKNNIKKIINKIKKKKKIKRIVNFLFFFLKKKQKKEKIDKFSFLQKFIK